MCLPQVDCVFDNDLRYVDYFLANTTASGHDSPIASTRLLGEDCLIRYASCAEQEIDRQARNS